MNILQRFRITFAARIEVKAIVVSSETSTSSSAQHVHLRNLVQSYLLTWQFYFYPKSLQIYTTYLHTTY